MKRKKIIQKLERTKFQFEIQLSLAMRDAPLTRVSFNRAAVVASDLNIYVNAN